MNGLIQSNIMYCTIYTLLSNETRIYCLPLKFERLLRQLRHQDTVYNLHDIYDIKKLSTVVLSTIIYGRQSFTLTRHHYHMQLVELKPAPLT